MSLDEAASPKPRGPRHAAKKERRRIWPRHPWAQAGIVFLLVIALMVTGYAGYLWYQSTRVHHVDVKGLTSAPNANGTDQTENILMVGSTDRCALKSKNPAYGLCSQGVTGVNSDVVMILHLDWTLSRVSILSIPRDTFIPNARKDGANKIDAALAEGPSQLVNAVQKDFAIPIQHFVELNFDTFAGVVDALGGVNMYFPKRVYDAESGLAQFHIGCNHLNGIQALQVVRARHLQYQPNDSYGPDTSGWPQEQQSDLARIRRNHEFIRVLAAAVAKQGISDPITDAKLITAVAPQLTVDTSLGTQDMINLILHFHGVNSQTAPQYTLPVMASNSYSYYYKGYDYGNVAFPDNVPDLVTIQSFLGVTPRINTITGHQLPRPKTITVAVLNGSGTTNQAADTAAALGKLGYKIGTIGDAVPVGNPAETLVAYNSTKPQVVANAQRVIRSLSGQAILAYEPSQAAPVTVITGTTFAVNSPPAPVAPTTTTTHPSGTTSPTASTTTSTAPTTTTTIPGFAPTSPNVESLQPWDPRSCTASGGEGP